MNPRRTPLRVQLLATAVMAGLGATQTLGALTIDLRISNLLGGGVIANNKLVTGAVQGTTVFMQVWAQVTGSAGNSTAGIAQCMQGVSGSFLSTGSMLGNLQTLTISLPFKALGHSVGFLTDLDGDGDLDVGSNNEGDSANFFAARANRPMGPKSNADGSTPFLSVNQIPGGWEYLLATERFIVTNLAPSPAAINFRRNNAHAAAVWIENAAEDSTDNFDGTTSYSYSGGQILAPDTGILGPGAPVMVVAIPEPLSLGLLGACSFGMLARRRAR